MVRPNISSRGAATGWACRRSAAWALCEWQTPGLRRGLAWLRRSAPEGFGLLPFVGQAACLPSLGLALSGRLVAGRLELAACLLPSLALRALVWGWPQPCPLDPISPVDYRQVEAPRECRTSLYPLCIERDCLRWSDQRGTGHVTLSLCQATKRQAASRTPEAARAASGRACAGANGEGRTGKVQCRL